MAPLDTTTANLESGLLFPYSRSAALYHCPGDTSFVTNRPDLLRTRSYCMNISLHCDDAVGSYLKQSAILTPSPSHLFVLIDTHQAESGTQPRDILRR